MDGKLCPGIEKPFLVIFTPPPLSRKVPPLIQKFFNPPNFRKGGGAHYKEEEDFASFVKEVLSDVSPSDYINFDMEFATSQSPPDVESIAWRKRSRQEAIN